MPRTARFHIAALDDLFHQLQYAPPETRRRQMDAAESLLREIDADQNYPEDFIVFRITGYRPELAAQPAVFVGQALLGDLANLVQRLSESLELPSTRESSTATPIAELAARLRVSIKSLQRYRRLGLVCHFVRFADGETRLSCFDDAIAHFTSRNPGILGRAAAFSRIGSQGESSIIEAAKQLRQNEHVSLNEAALRLAEQHGRAHETIRLILRRHDRRSREPIFTEPGPLTPQQSAVILRAWEFGVPMHLLKQRYGKTASTIRRAVIEQAADRLLNLDLHAVEMATFQRADAEVVILSAPSVRAHLDDLLPHDDAATLVQAAQERDELAERDEHAMIAAMNFLKHRVIAAMPALRRKPSASMLDAMETNLRWASLLQQRLVSETVPAIIRRIELTLSRPIMHATAREIRDLLELGVNVALRTIETLDPNRGQRLDRAVSFALDRALASRASMPPPIRAAPRHLPGSIPISGLFDSLSHWPWAELRPSWRRYVVELEEPAREAITLRYGLLGESPLTITAIAERLETTPTAAAHLVRSARIALRNLAATPGLPSDQRP